MGHERQYGPIAPCISSRPSDFSSVRAAPEYQELDCPDRSSAWSLACWEAFDAASKVDLHACALALADGCLFFVDPIPLARAALEELLAAEGVNPAGIVLTNGNHGRAADDFRRRLEIPLCAHPAAAAAAGLDADVTIPDEGGPLFDGALEAVPLPGAAAGEMAFYRAGGGGLVIVGDALINLPSHPFSVLPDKYCDDPKALRRSLARLLERPFATLAFAHGQPLTVNPRARLAALLGEKLPALK